MQPNHRGPFRLADGRRHLQDRALAGKRQSYRGTGHQHAAQLEKASPRDSTSLQMFSNSWMFGHETPSCVSALPRNIAGSAPTSLDLRNHKEENCERI